MVVVPEKGAPEIIFLSVVTAEYLPRLMALKASLAKAYWPDVSVSVLLVGGEAAFAAAGQHGLDFVRVEDLGIPTFWDMAFRYEKGALANALKPFFIQHVMRTRHPRTAVFLDADIFVFSPLHEVHDLLDRGQASVVLTPHFERPHPRAREPFEHDLLRVGMINGGFVALRSGAEAEAFLAWWSSHLLTECRYELDKGLYGDQHWLDLVPSLFGGVHILRHRGYNAAYWNFPDRRPRLQGGRWKIDADPLRFFHFSQWRIEQGETVEACMERLFQCGDGELRALLNGYREACRVGAATLPAALVSAEYPYGRFLDGTPIPKIVRDAYAALVRVQSSDQAENFGRALEKLLAPAAELPVFDSITIPELYLHIWRSREDLHNGRFDLETEEGQLAFAKWVLTHGAQDHALPAAALEPARRTVLLHQKLVLPTGVDVVAAARDAKLCLEQARALHGSSEMTQSALDALLAHASGILLALCRLFGVAGPESSAAPDALFSAVRALWDRLPQNAAEFLRGDFEAIERHREYLATESARVPGRDGDTADYDLAGPAVPIEGDEMLKTIGDEEPQARLLALEADAVINTCGNLMSMVEKVVAQARVAELAAGKSGSR